MTRVLKLGGRAQAAPELPDAIAALRRQDDAALCIVHGGGAEVTALQTRLGGQATFVDGRRVTSEEDLEALRMALSGSANKRLVAALVTAGVPALGLSGEDASLLLAEPLDRSRLGAVGRPVRVNTALLRRLLDAGYLPVLSPLARDVGGGGPLNVNADDAAAAIAAALGAAELLLVSDVAGVLVDGVPRATLDTGEIGALVSDGAVHGGMRAKLEAALAALESGVASVRIGDARLVHDPYAGTTIIPSRSLT